jgi:hypothetical protein
MLQLLDNEKKAFMAVAQSRNGVEILAALKRRREELVIAWLRNCDSTHGAHMRGKVSELDELTQLLESLSKSKE